MAANLLELFILGALAIYLVNKLLYIVGSVEEDDPMKKRSEFQETASIKDVTNTARNMEDSVSSAIMNISNQFSKLKSLIPNFQEDKFLEASKSAMGLIIESHNEQDTQRLSELVDPIFLDKFRHNYDFKNMNVDNVTGKIIDIFIFGNNISIIVRFDKIMHKKKETVQEWTFIKNANKPDPNWYLKNINDSE